MEMPVFLWLYQKGITDLTARPDPEGCGIHRSGNPSEILMISDVGTEFVDKMRKRRIGIVFLPEYI